MNYTKSLTIFTISLICLSCLASLYTVKVAQAGDFDAVRSVTFMAINLPWASNWTVTLDGVTISSNTDSSGLITFSKHSGNYSYSVTGPDNYLTANSTGLVSVGIFDISVPIYFSALGNWTYIPNYHTSAYEGIEVSGGNIALVGNRYSPDTNSYDGWLAMTSPNGNLLWDKTYGGSGYDFFLSITQTSDGGFAMTGYGNSFGAGDYDGWLVKVNAQGDLLWNTTFGGDLDDSCKTVISLSDGGFAVVGATASFGGGIGIGDGWLNRFDSTGKLLWNRTYGGPKFDSILDLAESSNGTLVLVGTTYIAGWANGWLIGVDSVGSLLWNITYDEAGSGSLYSIAKSSDGGFALAGYTSFHSRAESKGWLVRVDDTGNLLWKKTYGGIYNGSFSEITTTPDGGFALVGGLSYLNSGWLAIVDGSGNLLWNNVYTANDGPHFYSITRLSTGGFALIGYVKIYPNYTAGWLVRTDFNGYTTTIYDLKMNVIGEGSVYPGNSSYTKGKSVHLVAVPADGWSFTGWSGAAMGSKNTTLQTSGNVTVTATFSKNPYLTLYTAGQGSVSSANQSYPSGTIVNLQAMPAKGWSFSGWSGDVVAISNTTVTLTTNLTVTAKFSQNNYTLTIITHGGGSVNPGNASYLSGETVALNATPTAGWSFAGWTGDALGAANTTIIMDSSKTITATFTENPSPSPFSSPSPTTSSPAPTPTPKPSAATSPSPQTTESPTPVPSTPEFPTTMLLLSLLGFLFAAVAVKKSKTPSGTL